jgi:acetyl/propionyl-CoA carboxylase alpha subunit
VSKTKPIRRVAIVNRGEAAMRCIRAVKALAALEGSDLIAVALYTDVDRDAPFVRHADLVHHLPREGSAVSSYLNHDLLISALHEVKADAVWPGWGFVAEDAVFADRVEEEGMIFLGPSGDTMRKLGDKIASKRLAESANVPVTAWSRGEVESAEDAIKHGEAIGYPLVVKASAGGGGRGIRMVDTPEELPAAFESAASEALNAFGDGRLFMEGKVTGGRHIEVQIVADKHGQVSAVGCRDCSVQRRHQKVLEEAPPLGLSTKTLDSLKECSVRLASSVGYSGVGTVEFLVKDPEIFFLEMNPRLQVEHGITEAITGADLVQDQIRIGRGERLLVTEYEEQGVAIEARVCAEDPDQGFLPAPGRIACFDPALGPRIRIDTGVVAGSTVPADFDSLIAKVIAVGTTREEARARLSCALNDFDLVIEGGATNKGYIIELLDSEDYRRGGVDTLWLDRWSENRTEKREFAAEALVAASLLAYRKMRNLALINFYSDTSGATPASAPASVGYELDLGYGGDQYRLDVFALGSRRYRIHLDGTVVGATLYEEGANAARLQIRDQILRIVFDVTDTDIRVEVEGCAHRFSRQTAGRVCAGTPSSVVAIHFKPGDEVQAGQSLGLLEAMKMEIGFDAPVSGVVTEVHVQKGQQVAAGDILLVIEPTSDEEAVGEQAERLSLPVEEDALAALFALNEDGSLGHPDLLAADRADIKLRRSAIAAVQEEIRRILLGYDANPKRVQGLIAFLEAPFPEELSEEFRKDLSQIASGISLFSDIEELFIRTPRASALGSAGPSNNSQLRVFLRRMGEEGEGMPEEFLTLLKCALAHYRVDDLSRLDLLQRSMLRLFSSQREPDQRHRLVHGIVRCVMRLAESGIDMASNQNLEHALTRIASMRGRLANELADLAVDGRYKVFQEPGIERSAERSTVALERWLAQAADVPTPPPADIVNHLATAQRAVFNRVGRWLVESDPRHRRIALGVALRRYYAPRLATEVEPRLPDDELIECLKIEGAGVVVGSLASKNTLAEVLERVISGRE